MSVNVVTVVKLTHVFAMVLFYHDDDDIDSDYDDGGNVDNTNVC